MVIGGDGHGWFWLGYPKGLEEVVQCLEGGDEVYRLQWLECIPHTRCIGSMIHTARTLRLGLCVTYVTHVAMSYIHWLMWF